MARADIARLVAAGVFLALCASIAVPTATTFCDAFGEKARGAKRKTAVAERIKKARGAMESEFPQKLSFVNLNGLFIRLIGQHLCNGVLKTEPHDILLQTTARPLRAEKFAAKMRQFADYCARHKARFLYVQLPRKLDIRNRMIPAGVEDQAYVNVRKMLKSFREARIDCLDMCTEFAAMPDDVARNFYRTDHHWRNDAAFRMAGLLAAEIARRCSVPEADALRAAKLLSPESWTREVHPSCFLGSLGRRTGSLFSGLDDLTVLRPRFKTRMSIRVPSKGVDLTGTFEETNMRRADEALSSSSSFVMDAYSALYVGGIYPQTVHENPGAPLRVRVLLIGDSFARPVEAFLSVAVRRLDVIDLRRTKRDFRLSKYVRQMKPDIVVQMINPGSINIDKPKGPKVGAPAMFLYGL